MKPLLGRETRRLVLGLTVFVALAAVGLLLGSTQAARASIASLDPSTKSASSDKVSPGSVFTYTIVVRNDGAALSDPITVADALPAEVDYVPLSGFSLPEGSGIAYALDPARRNITFTIPSLAASASVTVGFRVQVDTSVAPDTVVANTAVIDDGDATVERSVSVTVEAPPAVAIKAPWDNQLITTRGQFAVAGRAWTPDQTPGFPGTAVLTTSPDPLPAGQNFYYVQWDPVPGALVYVLQEALDPHFDQLTSYDGDPAVSPVYFSGKAPGTYYYRVLARNLYEGFWSDPISVTVTSSGLAAQAEPVAPQATLYQPVIEVNVKPVGGADNWVPATSVTLNAGGWWDWTYDWALPQEDDAQYMVQARAKDLAGNYDPDAVDTVVVTIKNGQKLLYFPVIYKRWPPVPYPPTLQLASQDGPGAYTLSWTYGHATAFPTSYRIQESRDAAFTDLVTDQALPLSPTQFSVTGRSGTLYYRVAGVNSYGRGEWSNVVPVTSGYFDDFSNPASGWPRTVYRQDNRDVFDASYETGNQTYRAKIMLNTQGLNNYRMGTVGAPWDNPNTSYDVEVSHYFAVAGDQAATPEAGKGGLIFGANNDYTKFYVLEWNFEGSCAISKYINAGKPLTDVRFVQRVSFRDWGTCTPVKKGYNQTNVARVTVSGNTATAYINGVEIKSFTDNDLYNLHEVGFLSGSWERTPVEGRFDNFRVTPH